MRVKKMSMNLFSLGISNILAVNSITILNMQKMFLRNYLDQGSLKLEPEVQSTFDTDHNYTLYYGINGLEISCRIRVSYVPYLGLVC